MLINRAICAKAVMQQVKVKQINALMATAVKLISLINRQILSILYENKILGLGPKHPLNLFCRSTSNAALTTLSPLQPNIVDDYSIPKMK